MKKITLLIFFGSCVLVFLVFMIAGQAAALGTETLITTGTAGSGQMSPAIWEDRIVWQDNRNGNSDIYMYNLTSGIETRITGSVADAHDPAIFENYLVWSDTRPTGNLAVYYYNLADPSPHETLISSSSGEARFPRIYGDVVVWQDNRNGNSDIYLYTLPDGPEMQVTTDPADQVFPVIWGDTIAWQDEQNLGAGQSIDIYLFNITTQEERWFTPDPGGILVNLNNQEHPAIWDGHLVWQDDRNLFFSGGWDICRNDTSATPKEDQVSTTGGTIRLSPGIFSNRIVWLDDVTGRSYNDIYLNNTANADGAVRITGDSSKPVDPTTETPRTLAIYNNRIVWQDARNGNPDIFLYTDGVTVTCPSADFVQNTTSGALPLAVQFTGITSPDPAYRHWDFGDGTGSDEQDPIHVYTSPGTFAVSLTVNTPFCRDAAAAGPAHTISAGTAPVAAFSATPREGMVPHTVYFTDASTGSPSFWNWSFGDGTYSELKNPPHDYLSGGIFSITLNATNAFGLGHLTKPDYITVTTGAHTVATTSIGGIGVSVAGNQQQLTYTTGILPGYTLTTDHTTLITGPPASYGWQNITFQSGSAPYFTVNPVSITGAISRATLTTNDITPSGFSSGVGTNLIVNYQVTLPVYPVPATLTTDIWEGTTPADTTNFLNTIYYSNFASMHAAYTVNTIRNSLGTPAGAVLNTSVSSAWETGSGSIETERSRTYTIATGYDSNGNLLGIVLPARFTGNDTTSRREYFETVIPAQYPFLTKFALAKLTGSGNPIQIITLSVSSRAGETDTSGGSDTGLTGTAQGAPAAIQNPVAPESKAPLPPDPGKTANLYLNANAVITQATILQSNDHLATIRIDPGIVARDADGNPLASVMIARITDAKIPPPPASSAISYAGMAYEIQPDGATFSPAITVTFMNPDTHWGEDYIVRTYNKGRNAWEDLATAYDPQKGTISAETTHFCCIALFAKTIPFPNGSAITPTVTLKAPAAPVPPAPTAISIVTGMVYWVVMTMIDHVFLVALIAIICLVIIYWRYRRDYRYRF